MFHSETLPQISCQAYILSRPQQHCTSCFTQTINPWNPISTIKKESPQNAFHGTPPFWKYQHIKWKHKYLEKIILLIVFSLTILFFPTPPQWKKYISLLYHDF